MRLWLFIQFVVCRKHKKAPLGHDKSMKNVGRRIDFLAGRAGKSHAKKA